MDSKPQEIRVRECLAIRAQLRYLKCESECGELVDAMNFFVRDGSSATGKFRVPSLENRVMFYILSNAYDSYAVLRKE
jgi:hypothetical protein